MTIADLKVNVDTSDCVEAAKNIRELNDAASEFKCDMAEMIKLAKDMGLKVSGFEVEFIAGSIKTKNRIYID